MRSWTRRLCGRDHAASYIFGGIGYAFIIAMAATSFDRSAAAIGPRAWRILHLTGGYYLLFQFMVSFGKRIPDMPLYALFLIPLLVVIALRLDRDGGDARPAHGPGRLTAPSHVGGISPRRLAMILSTMRFGRTAVISWCIGSGVIW